ncbi:MAG: hypothetical protein ACXWVT_05090 [Burkholderiaceae bacterium]
MALLNSIAHRALRGRAARGLARVIPNPLVRYAAITVASVLLPMVIAALSKRRDPRAEEIRQRRQTVG